jgi:AraC-like DNA-binding protein
MPVLILSVPARLRRTGMESRLLIEGEGGGPRREPDRSVLRLLARAHGFQTMVMQNQGRSMTELAADAGVSPSYFTRVLRLSFLTPDIIRAILSGRQPPQLTAKHLVSQSRLARAWREQADQLGTP